jgi:hypothetical protein
VKYRPLSRCEPLRRDHGAIRWLVELPYRRHCLANDLPFSSERPRSRSSVPRPRGDAGAARGVAA